MSETTLTRKALRRAIALEMQMPFFRRFSAGEGTIDSGTTTNKIIDASLNQPSGFWEGHWFYNVATAEVSLIRSFAPADHSALLEMPLAATPSAGDTFEIHSVWNAIDIHDAINQAIDQGTRFFPHTDVDETLVICEDKMDYDITALSRKIWIINSVFAEKPTNLIRGSVASATVSSIVIAEAASALTGVTSSYLVSIYAGTGAGQVRAVSSVVGQTINPTVNWTTTPDSTSKYAVWNPNIQRFDWERVDIFYNDTDEYPDKLRLRTRLPTYYGMRLRIEYLWTETPMDDDTDTTIIPRGYVVPKAIGILHSRKVKDTRADRDLHYAEFQRNDKVAEDYALKNAPHMPGVTIRASESSTYMDMDDPLGWKGGGY